MLSGTIVWVIICVIFILPFEIKIKNILTFYCTGLMFPTAILLSKIIKAEWRVNDNPLGILGLYLNLAQFMYFPIIFYSFSKNPEQMIIFFAIITGAHIFPYGWLYNSKSFFIMAPAISLIIVLVGYIFGSTYNWIIPLSMVILLSILDIWIYKDYYKKVKLKINLKLELVD